jgi:hypothetical protein
MSEYKMKKEIIKVFWYGPFTQDDIIENKIDKDEEVKSTDIGLYQVYGSHPLYGDGVLVYIGRTFNSFKKRLKNRWVIESGTDTNNVKIYLGKIFSDNNIIDKKEEEEQIKKAEAILINVLTPAYNSSNIQNINSAIRNSKFTLYNEGNFRSLYPILESSYYWEERKNFLVTDELSKLYNEKIENEDNDYGFIIKSNSNIENEVDFWLGVDFIIWNDQNIPLVLEIDTENDIVIKRLEKLEKKRNDLIIEETTDGKIFFIGLDNDFMNMKIDKQKLFLDNLISQIKKDI